MNPLVNQKPCYSMAWAPAQVKRLPPPSRSQAFLGQVKSSEGSSVPLLLGDTLVAGASALFAWSLHKQNNSWSTFWWVVSGIAFVKGLHDASKLS